MTSRTLTVREFSRATLARQMLLARARLPAPEAIDRLAGLQAQLPIAPYVGLWTRLHDFRREDLARPIEERRVVKATLMRATLHLFSVEDYLGLRATLQPALDQAAGSIARRRAPELDYERSRVRLWLIPDNEV
jgi:Winged helix DNA-binding domain